MKSNYKYLNEAVEKIFFSMVAYRVQLDNCIFVEEMEQEHLCMAMDHNKVLIEDKSEVIVVEMA